MDAKQFRNTNLNANPKYKKKKNQSKSKMNWLKIDLKILFNIHKAKKLF